MSGLKEGRGDGWFWRLVYRAGLARPQMPHWRVVVEAAPDRARRSWPEEVEGAVVSVWVWARTAEEAEGLAQLAIDEEGLSPITADAMREPPESGPRAESGAIARSGYVFYGKIGEGSAPVGRQRHQ